MQNIKKIPPKPGQESVWDYPRPPRLELTSRHLQVVYNQVVIAETQRALRVLETSHPPNYYFPPEDVLMKYFHANQEVSFCEFKGKANYYDVIVNDRHLHDAAWAYFKPTKGFQELTGYIAFYPNKVDACYVDGEKVQAQEGGFYGGWITNDVVGPFKGGPGTWGW